MAESEVVGRLREAYEAVNRGDFHAAVGLVPEDFELWPAERGPESDRVFRGRDGVLAYLEPDAFEEQRGTPLEFVEGPDVVVVHVRAWARGAGSGIELENDTFHVWRLSEGEPRRLEVYDALERAYEAAGLASG